MTFTEQTSNEKAEPPQTDLNGEASTSSPESSAGPKQEENKTAVKVDGSENKVLTAAGDFTYNHQEIHLHKEENPQRSQFTIPSITIDENLPAWFASLDSYGKYYAIALCFYNRMKVADFLIVLPVIRNHLIRNGDIEKKADAPLHHLAVETIEVRDDTRRALIIQYPSEITAGEILTLLKQKYSSSLFNFLSIIDEIVKNNPNNWELRWRSAAALGQISELDVEHVYKTVINSWIADDKAYVRATVGYYFYYILDEDNIVSSDTRDYVLGELKKLANPKVFKPKLWRYSWTAVATCEKIGLLKSNQVNNMASSYLEGLAGINHIRVADSVIHALVEWSVKENFAQALNLLITWVESASAGDLDDDNPYQIRCVIALLAFRAIVEVNYDLLNEEDNIQDMIVPVEVLKVIWDNQSESEDLWQGTIWIGVRYFEFRMGQYFFDMLESWMETTSDKEFLIEFVSSWLKEIFFNLRSKTHLENRLKNVWAKSKNKTLRTIAQMVQEKIKKGI